METTSLNAMQAYCDRVVSQGKELSITWEGGNDNGWLYLVIDGKEIQEPNEIEQQIITFVEAALGYGSFAGDFSTDGKLTYDRENKCFIGEDNYGEATQDSTECEIDLSMPEKIWFDNLLLNVQSDGDIITVTILLQINNGPHPESFDELKEQMEAQISEQFTKVTNPIEDFSGIWEDYRIRRTNFEQNVGMLHYKIESFAYERYETETKVILLHLK